MAEPCPPQYDRPRFETFKMSKYIVNVTADKIQPPEYLRNIDWSKECVNFKMVLKSNQEIIKLRKEKIEEEKDYPSDVVKSILPKLKSFKINPLQLSDWPSAEELGMDMPQYIAFQSAITQEISIIQGPPGKFNFCQSISRKLLFVRCFMRNGKNLHWFANNEVAFGKFTNNF